MNDVRPVLNAKHYAIITAAFLAVRSSTAALFRCRTRPNELGPKRPSDISKAMSRGCSTRIACLDFAANVILFVPLGFLAGGMVLWLIAAGRSPLLALIPAMAFLRAAIEFESTLVSTDRNTNINDIAATISGRNRRPWRDGGVLRTGVLRIRNQIRHGKNSAPAIGRAKALPAYVLLLGHHSRHAVRPDAEPVSRLKQINTRSGPGDRCGRRATRRRSPSPPIVIRAVRKDAAEHRLFPADRRQSSRNFPGWRWRMTGIRRTEY